MLSGRKRRTVPELPAQPGLVVEDPESGSAARSCGWTATAWCWRTGTAATGLFPLRPAGFLVDGKAVTLTRPPVAPPQARTRSASGSRTVAGLRRADRTDSRIRVEGLHDATMVERVWGHDLRVEGVVVQPLDGVDELAGGSPSSGHRPTAGSGCWWTTWWPAARRAGSWRR